LSKKSCLTHNSQTDHQQDPRCMVENFTALNEKKMRIGILGGTFNPIHLGHVKMGIDAHDEFLLSKVLYIPTGRPPHKHNNEIEQDYHRLAMIDLAISMPYMRLDDMEINRQGMTYTIDTLRALEKKYPNSERYYIIGSDTLFMLDTWKDFHAVLGLTNFIVFLRLGDDEKAVANSIDFYNTLGKKKICLASNYGLDVSSTQIRFNIAHGLSLCDMLPQKVIEYIGENKIYL
jgi:nicotinate-nucleotide adenylyltransferase